MAASPPSYSFKPLQKDFNNCQADRGKGGEIQQIYDFGRQVPASVADFTLFKPWQDENWQRLNPSATMARTDEKLDSVRNGMVIRSVEANGYYDFYH